MGIITLISILSIYSTHLSSASVEFWRVSYPPDTNDFHELLRPFHPIHQAWGNDSLGYSDKHGNSLSVHYRQHSYSRTPLQRGGGFYSTPSNLGPKVDNVILMYDVFFENFGFGHMGKLPGLFGGETGNGAYKCTGGHNPSTCFTLRLMWRDNGQGEVYAYISDDQASGFDNRDDVIADSDWGHSIGRGRIHFKNGEWQTILEQVHLNSDPSTADGWVKVCVIYKDGSRECYTAHNLVIRKNSHHHLRGLIFSTFFGGGSKEDGAPNDCHTYFKNFRLKYPSSDVHVG